MPLVGRRREIGRDTMSIGAQDRVLVDMERRSHLHRVSRGLYRFRTFPSARDELMAATLWPDRLGVISHDSALNPWDLCDVNPADVTNGERAKRP